MIYASSTPAFLGTARQAAIRSSEYSPDALVAVIFAHLSLEAFVNEVLFRVNSHDSTTLPEPLAKLQTISVEKDLQGQRTSLETKMKVIGVCLSDKGLNFGAAPLQDLTQLISLRNFLVHSRPEQLVTEPAVTNDGVATAHQVELHKLGTFLVSRRVIPRSPREVLMPLLAIAQMPSVAIWAHNTVVESIRTLLVLFPNDGWRSSVSFALKLEVLPPSVV